MRGFKAPGAPASISTKTTLCPDPFVSQKAKTRKRNRDNAVSLRCPWMQKGAESKTPNAEPQFHTVTLEGPFAIQITLFFANQHSCFLCIVSDSSEDENLKEFYEEYFQGDVEVAYKKGEYTKEPKKEEKPKTENKNKNKSDALESDSDEENINMSNVRTALLRKSRSDIYSNLSEDGLYYAYQFVKVSGVITSLAVATNGLIKTRKDIGRCLSINRQSSRAVQMSQDSQGFSVSALSEQRMRPRDWTGRILLTQLFCTSRETCDEEVSDLSVLSRGHSEKITTITLDQ